MVHFSTMFNDLVRSISIRKDVSGRGYNRKEAMKAMTKEAKKSNKMLRSSGVVNADDSKNFTSVFSKRGQKGVNQDCIIVWEEFGCKEDILFCGVFDGHGPWGHYVAKMVRDSLPTSLFYNWQESVSENSHHGDPNLEPNQNLHAFDFWENSYIKTCAAIDRELHQERRINSFESGTTGLILVKQGDLVTLANIGDSRAVLATTSDDGNLIPLQLTVDLKPNLPQEAERIKKCKGKVFCLDDEPGLHRVWLPHGETPGLAMSRAFGDYCLKPFGVISEPVITQRKLTSHDQFIVLATDGVWDVISNEEAIQIVWSVGDRAKCAKHLVKCAANAWKGRRGGIAMDDISALCLFFNTA